MAVKTTGTLPETMTAIAISTPGGPEVLKPESRPVPMPGPGQVLIKVAAAGVNRPDVQQRLGAYDPPPGASDLPGLEVSGTVVAVADDVDAGLLGQDVCALTPGGGYAEYCVTFAPHCLRYPKGMDAVNAGALPETFFTVWYNVFMRGGLSAGETMLLHGGSSGIGTTAIQLAAQRGAKAIVTVGDARKAEACKALGAHRTILYKEEDFVAIGLEETGGAGVDMVVDMVAGDYVARNFKVLKNQGRYVFIAFLGGAKVTLDLTPIMIKRLHLTGSTMRPRTVEEKAEIARQLGDTVWPMLDAGTVKPVLHATFPLTQASDAHGLMESSTHIGKIMLTV